MIFTLRAQVVLRQRLEMRIGKMYKSQLVKCKDTV